MPVPRDEFDEVFACEFYDPADIMAPDELYSVYEIARLLQGLDPDDEIDVETEAVLLDWAIPWVIENADDLVVAEPRDDDEPGYYGVRTAEE